MKTRFYRLISVILSVLMVMSVFSVVTVSAADTGKKDSGAGTYTITAQNTQGLFASSVSKSYKPGDEFDLTIRFKAKIPLVIGQFDFYFDADALVATKAAFNSNIKGNLSVGAVGNQTNQKEYGGISSNFQISGTSSPADFSAEDVLMTVTFKVQNEINKDRTVRFQVSELWANYVIDDTSWDTDVPYVENGVVDSAYQSDLSANAVLSDAKEQPTQPPTTAEPTTVPPTTEAPTTAKPTTVPPATEAPTTAKPTTVPPTTEAPTTAKSTTVPPTTEAPTTAKPTTVPPTTEAPEPTTQKPEPTTEKTEPVTTKAPEPTTEAFKPTTAEPSTTSSPDGRYKITVKNTQGLFDSDVEKRYKPGDEFELTVRIKAEIPLVMGEISAMYSADDLVATKISFGGKIKGSTYAGTVDDAALQKKHGGIFPNFTAYTPADFTDEDVLITITFKVQDEINQDRIVNFSIKELWANTDANDMDNDIPYIENGIVSDDYKDDVYARAVLSDVSEETSEAVETTAAVGNYTLFYLPSSAQENAGNTYKINYQDNQNSWHIYTMSKTSLKINDIYVYSVLVTKNDTNVKELQYQVYNGEEWISQKKFTNVNLEDYDNKMVKSDGSVVLPTEPATTTAVQPTTEKPEPVTTAAQPTTEKTEPVTTKAFEPTTTAAAQETTSASGYKVTVHSTQGIFADASGYYKPGDTFDITYRIEAKVPLIMGQFSVLFDADSLLATKLVFNSKIDGYKQSGAVNNAENQKEHGGIYPSFSVDVPADYTTEDVLMTVRFTVKNGIKKDQVINFRTDELWANTVIDDNSWDSDIGYISFGAVDSAYTGDLSAYLILSGSSELPTESLVTTTAPKPTMTAAPVTTKAPEPTITAAPVTTKAPEPTTTVAPVTTKAPEPITTAAPESNYTFYYMPSSSSETAGYSYKLNFNDIYGTAPQNWHPYNFVKSSFKADGVHIYSLSIPKTFDKVSELQYQVYNGDNWVSQNRFDGDSVYLSDFDNMVVKSDGTIVTLEEVCSTGKGNYYVAGTMNSWTPNEAFKLVENPSVPGEYMLLGFIANAQNGMKVAYSDNGVTFNKNGWYPADYGKNYIFDESGIYNVYFRPNGNVEWDNGCFYVEKAGTVEPATTHASVSETYTTKFTNNKGWSKVYLYAWDGAGGQNAKWPGVELTDKDVNGFGEEQFTAVFDAKYKNIIFNDGSEQTVDIVFDPTVTGYYLTEQDPNQNNKWLVDTWTEEPETEEPITEAPTTVAPTTETPTTEAPTTQAPTTEAPTTEAPTTEAPSTMAPATEATEPTTGKPVTEPPETETTVTEPITTEAVEPSTEKITSEPQATEAPETTAAAEPVTTEVIEPTSTVAEITESSTYSPDTEPDTENPVTEPTTAGPAAEPTTFVPEPTTARPETLVPETTVEPNTEIPDTEPTEEFNDTQPDSEIPVTEPVSVTPETTENTTAEIQPSAPVTEPSTDALETEPAETNAATPQSSENTEKSAINLSKTNISKWKVSGIKNKTYTGKKITQKIKVQKGKQYATFKVKYKNNTQAGKAVMTIYGTGKYTGTIVKTFKIYKKKQPAKISVSKKTVKTGKLSGKSVTIKPFKIKNAKGKVTWTKVKSGLPKSIYKKISVKKSNGKIKLKKGSYTKGTLKITVKIKIAGDKNHKGKTVKKVVKVKLK